jgi:hypothetical protein
MTDSGYIGTNTCNRHYDCRAAEERWRLEHPDALWIPADFHCYDECCEECFGY